MSIFFSFHSLFYFATFSFITALTHMNAFGCIHSFEYCVLGFNRSGNKVPTELPLEATNALHFLDAFMKVSGLPRQTLSTYIPNTILDMYQVLAC